MRKITAGLFMTLDGVIEAPEKWNPPYYNEEMTQVVMGQMADSDTQLYGRRSYELFRTVFTGPSAPAHGEMMTSAPKIVVSTTLKHPGWGPTTLISGDVAAELTKLKQQPGKNISTGGSGTLIRFLLQEGLLDELTLLVHPVVAGSGARLFEGGTGQVPLKLLESRPLSTGVVVLRYAPAAEPGGQP
jgi:dihydrofolate reductase